MKNKLIVKVFKNLNKMLFNQPNLSYDIIRIKYETPLMIVQRG
jgi:hypothetical protein